MQRTTIKRLFLEACQLGRGLRDSSAKQLPCKHRDWSTSPQNLPRKLQLWWWYSLESTAMGDETGRPLGLADQPSHLIWQIPGQWEILSQKAEERLFFCLPRGCPDSAAASASNCSPTATGPGVRQWPGRTFTFCQFTSCHCHQM